MGRSYRNQTIVLIVLLTEFFSLEMSARAFVNFRILLYNIILYLFECKRGFCVTCACLSLVLESI